MKKQGYQKEKMMTKPVKKSSTPAPKMMMNKTMKKK